MSNGNSTLSIQKSLALITEAIEITATLKDDYGNPAVGEQIVFRANPGIIITPRSAVTDENGQIIVDATSTTPGTYKVAASHNGYLDVELHFVTTAQLTVSSRCGEVVANNRDTATITTALTDTRGKPLSRQDITFSVDNPILHIEPYGSTDERGHLNVGVRTSKAGTYTVTARCDSHGTTVQNMVKVHFVADVSTAKITMITDQKVLPVSQSATVVATVQDANNNPLKGVVEFLSDALTRPASATIGNDGKAETRIHATTAAPYTVTARYVDKKTGAVIEGQTSVKFTADISSAGLTNSYSSVTLHRSALAGQESIAIARLIDDYGNPVPDQVIVISADNPSVDLWVSSQKASSKGAIKSPVEVTTDRDGQAKVKASAQQAGSHTLTFVQKSNGKSSTLAFDVSANSNTASIANKHSSLSVSGPAVADGINEINVTAILKDPFANPVPRATITLAAPKDVKFTSSPDQSNLFSLVTDAEGRISTTLVSKNPGTYSITAWYKGIITIDGTFTSPQ